MSEDKILKVEFAPGCFDNLDIEDQAELDELVAHIKEMFEGKTQEEIMAMSKPVDMDELLEEEPELAEALIKQMNQINEPRKLQ